MPLEPDTDLDFQDRQRSGFGQMDFLIMLGLKSLRALSGKSRLPPECAKLPDDVQDLSSNSRNLTATQLRSSPEFKVNVDQLFEKYGPMIWCTGARDWLITAGKHDSYPEDLYYNNDAHRHRLRGLFQEAVFEKCVRDKFAPGKAPGKAAKASSKSQTTLDNAAGSSSAAGTANEPRADANLQHQRDFQELSSDLPSYYAELFQVDENGDYYSTEP